MSVNYYYKYNFVILAKKICTAKLILYKQWVKMRQDIIVFST